MKTKLLATILWICVVGWLGMIFIFSSQDGEQTAQISGSLAQEAAEIIYENPTAEQVESVHIHMRKFAHIGLFIVLGILLWRASNRIFLQKKWLVWVVSIGISVSYSYFDEWHKQFIDGRHFQLDEAFLNVISSLGGIFIAAGVAFLMRKVCSRKERWG